MLEHTKKRPTKRVVLTFSGPVSKKDKAVELMESLGFMDTSDSVSWRDAFPEYRDNEPGTALAGARYKEDLTQRQLSDLTGIPQRHISEMENGKRTIGRKNARLLADALNIDYRVFM
ncbi:MAG: helix-turn-helix transcriptional regulator [Thermodesulfobacteriota bacterium]|nr:helix-turn-helix transcriptional regulator [Thermodesulfobacteriota bacterium]